MFLHLPHIHSASLRRTVYIVCLCFVFSYIAFDVLDLDGSNLYSLNPPQRFSIVAVITCDAEIPYCFSDSVGGPPPGKNLLPTGDQSARPQAHWSLLTVFSLARAHGYRVTLARNSLSDSSPYG